MVKSGRSVAIGTAISLTRCYEITASVNIPLHRQMISNCTSYMRCVLTNLNDTSRSVNSTHVPSETGDEEKVLPAKVFIS